MRTAALALTGLLILGGTSGGCGVRTAAPAEVAVGVSERDECAPRLSPGVPAAQLEAAHGQARALGHERGAADAGAHIERRTRDGYRLRRITSTALMAVGLFLVGALAAGLLLGMLGKRPVLRYARRLDEAVDQAIAAVRTHGTAATGPAARLFAQLEAPLAAAERRSERLLDLATPLEEQRDSDLAKDQLEALYAKLTTLADAVERLAQRASTWRDRFGAEPDDEANAEIESAEAAHVDAFTRAVEALA